MNPIEEVIRKLVRELAGGGSAGGGLSLPGLDLIGGSGLTGGNGGLPNILEPLLSLTGGSAARGGSALGLASPVLSTLIGGLRRLATGTDADSEAPRLRFELPAPVNIDAGYSFRTDAVQLVDRGQGERLRTVPSAAIGQGPSVIVQVNALDSRSFLDRSDDIAQAVRQAMLSSSSLSSVLNED